MLGYSSVTQKGQITIPAGLREVMGLPVGQRVMIFRDADGLRVKKALDIFSLKGSVKAKKATDVLKMRQAFKRYLGTRKSK